ncbi:MAG: CvpA family protein [Bacteroidales bacterium]|nr:CvpA family protein [Bacteroidales bacterium]
MNIIKAYGRGFKNSLRHPKMMLLIFSITLILGLSIALPFFFSFQSAVGNSMVTSLNYTTASELVNFHSWNLDSIFGQTKFTVFIFWLLMIFFVGGIVRTFNKEDFTVSTFFAGAGVNFFRFLLCDVIMIATQVVTFLVLFGIASFVLGLFDNVVTETPLFWAYGVAGFIFACAIVLLLMISDYAKFYMEMAETSRVLKAIGKATKYVFNNFVKTYFLYALLLVAPLLALVLYKLTFDKIGTNTMFGIVAIFFVQQIFILLRVWFRVWSLSSQFELYADDYVQRIDYEQESVGKIVYSDGNSSENIVVSKSVVEENPIDKVDRIVVTINDPEKLAIDTITTSSKTEVINNYGDTFTTKTEIKEEEVEEEPDYSCNLADLTPKPEPEPAPESEPEPEPEKKVVVEEKTTSTTTVTEVINDYGDTFTTRLETAVNESADDKSQESTPEKTTAEEEVEEGLSKFYGQDQQGGNTESNLADLTPEPEIKKDSTPTIITTTTTSVTEKVEEEKTMKVEIPVSETVVTEPEAAENESSENESSENESSENETAENEAIDESETEPDDIDQETLEQFYANDQESEDINNLAQTESFESAVDSEELAAVEDSNAQDSNSDSDQGDDVDEELLAQYYDNESVDNSDPDNNQIDVEDIPDEDESVGATVSLDVEDDDDDMVTTITTTTTTTTVTTTTTTEQVDPNEPKVIKIYTEDEMREIAKQQQKSAGFEPDVEFTEIVPEDVVDGVPSGEQHQAEQFTEYGLSDGEDFSDPDSDALG